MKVHRNQRKQQGHEIAKIVPGFGEQRQRMGAQSGHDQQPDVSGGDDERHSQNLRGTLVRGMGMDVHLNSLRMVGAGFKIAVGSGVSVVAGDGSDSQFSAASVQNQATDPALFAQPVQNQSASADLFPEEIR